MAPSGPADWAEALSGTTSGGYPGIAAVYVMLGDAYARGGNSRRALGSFRKALALDRGHATARDRLRRLRRG